MMNLALQKEKPENCYVIFPKSQASLCNMLAQHISEKFKIHCKAIKYGNLNKKITHDINNFLQNSCILILGYLGTISKENCYKLGLAHAHQKQVKQVILINLTQDTKSKPNIPDYIRHQHKLSFKKNPTSWVELTRRIDNIFLSFLESRIDILYYKAVELCEEKEEELKCPIVKLDKNSFLRSLNGSLNEKLLNLYLNYYINDYDEELNDILILHLVPNQEVLMKIFSYEDEQFQSSSGKLNKVQETKVPKKEFSRSNIDNIGGIRPMTVNKIINLYKRRLQILEEQNAIQGFNTPPEILMEIEDIKKKINEIQQDKTKINQLSSIQLESKIELLEKENKQILINQSRNINISGGQVEFSGAGAGSQGDNYGITANTINQNTSDLTTKEISQLIKKLESVIASAQLPEKESKRFKPDLEAINAELQEPEPDKQEVKDRLEGITRRINKLTGTIDAANQLKDKVLPILEQIASWLGVAANYFQL